MDRIPSPPFRLDTVSASSWDTVSDTFSNNDAKHGHLHKAVNFTDCDGFQGLTGHLKNLVFWQKVHRLDQVRMWVFSGMGTWVHWCLRLFQELLVFSSELQLEGISLPLGQHVCCGISHVNCWWDHQNSQLFGDLVDVMIKLLKTRGEFGSRLLRLTPGSLLSKGFSCSSRSLVTTDRFPLREGDADTRDGLTEDTNDLGTFSGLIPVVLCEVGLDLWEEVLQGQVEQKRWVDHFHRVMSLFGSEDPSFQRPVVVLSYLHTPLKGKGVELHLSSVNRSKRHSSGLETKGPSEEKDVEDAWSWCDRVKRWWRSKTGGYSLVEEDGVSQTVAPILHPPSVQYPIPLVCTNRLDLLPSMSDGIYQVGLDVEQKVMVWVRPEWVREDQFRKMNHAIPSFNASSILSIGLSRSIFFPFPRLKVRGRLSSPGGLVGGNEEKKDGEREQSRSKGEAVVDWVECGFWETRARSDPLNLSVMEWVAKKLDPLIDNPSYRMLLSDQIQGTEAMKADPGLAQLYQLQADLVALNPPAPCMFSMELGYKDFEQQTQDLKPV